MCKADGVLSAPVECDMLQGQGTSLQKECEDLRSERTTLLAKLHTLEDQLTRYIYTQDRQTAG